VTANAEDSGQSRQYQEHENHPAEDDQRREPIFGTVDAALKAE
jgi:hypothetical protein